VDVVEVVAGVVADVVDVVDVVEVARTRMREEGSRYRNFWQTLVKVATNEGIRGVYRGLTTQLVKHIPNTAIMMTTYEAVVYLCRLRGF